MEYLHSSGLSKVIEPTMVLTRSPCQAVEPGRIGSEPPASYYEHGKYPLLHIRKTPQAIVRAKEQFAVGRSERGIGGFVDGVGGEQLKLGTGPQHEHVTRFVRHVNSSIGQEH